MSNPDPGPDLQKMTPAEYEQFKSAFLVLQRIAIIALHRLGGTMRIRDDEWASAEGADLQWRTLRVAGLEPEVHAACTLLSEAIELSNATVSALAALRDKPTQQ